MGQPMDYDGYAREYADTRWAFPWILEPLSRFVAETSSGAAILEVGCGTGNYINALAVQFPDRTFRGFDLSREMLAVAGSRSQTVEFLHASAEERFPYADCVFQMVFLVDVIHHIVDLENLFAESARVMSDSGSLIIVTDSETNIRRRSLTKFFPELVAIEMKRYPKLEELQEAARSAGLTPGESAEAEGQIELSDAFIDKLERKASSGMRLMDPEAHARGIERLRAAAGAGEEWLSCYTVLRYRKAHEPSTG